MNNNNQLIILYDQMSDHTKNECANCKVPYSCCNAMYCEMAKQYAKEEWRVLLIEPNQNSEIPFLGPNGCIVPPHLRPLCTLHTCEINGLGFKRNDQKWTEKYFELREQINELEYLKLINN